MSPNKRNKNKIRKLISEDMFSGGTVEDVVRYYKRKSSKRKTISRGFWNIAEFRSDYIFIRENLGRIAVYPVNADGEIGLTGFHVEGYVAENRFCPICHHIVIYDIDHDDFFCPSSCNTWLNKTCSVNLECCDYCATRPDKPLPTFGVNEDTYPERSRSGWNHWYWIPIDSE